MTEPTEGDRGVQVIRDSTTVDELRALASARFGDMVKAVVDVQRTVMAIGGDLHADEEALLIGDGSRQADVWGINLYPGDYGTSEFIEYDSMINVRPGQGNRSRSVDDDTIRDAIARVVDRLVRP